MLYTFLPEEPCDMLYPPPPPAGKAPWHDLPPPPLAGRVCVTCFTPLLPERPRDMLSPFFVGKAP